MPKTQQAERAGARFPTERETLCRTDLADAPSLLSEMVRLLAAAEPGFDADAALAALQARERADGSMLAPGVAMPHARLEGLTRTVVAVATSERGVAFRGSDVPVRLAVLVLTPSDQPAAYLKVAAGFARRMQEDGFVGRIAAAATASEVLAILSEGVEAAPTISGTVRAADLMEPAPAVLRETNSVKDAIDMITRTGLHEIPVVDKEGDLVGVATAQALLRLCLPDYLLWMEDLSSYSDFEPFGTLLRKEASTWLADITSDEYASAQADAPAISVAEAMARRGSGTCYVLDGARLAGVATLPRFLHNVFRD